MTGFICLRIIYDSMTNIIICLRVIICNHIASFSYRLTHLQLSQLTNVCTCHYTRRLVQCGKSTSIYLRPQCILLPRPLRHDPRFIQCIYRYSHAAKRLVEV